MEELKTSHRLFHSYCIRPNTRFDTQGHDEEVMLVVRAHPIVLLPPIINSLFLFFILVFLNFFIPSFLTVAQIVYFNVAGLVFILNYMWFFFINWHYNMGIITNQRVVDVDFHLIQYKETTYTKLSHIEDVTAKSGGFMGNLFNFGNLFIQTAGSEVNTEFINIPHPSSVAKIMDGLLQKGGKHE